MWGKRMTSIAHGRQSGMPASADAAPAPIERLLVVGLGSIGRRHARISRQLVPTAHIAAWRHRLTAEPLPVEVESSFTSLDEVVAFAPQAAVVASPATHHLDAAMALASAGVHLLVEKPIAASAAGVQALLDRCAEREVVLMTGYNMRFLPSLDRFRALLVEGVVGRPLSVRAECGSYLPSWRSTQDYREVASARASLGGGVLLELSHEFDYLRWLFGEVSWVQAVARTQSALEIDVEDTAHVILGFVPGADGASVIASVNLDFVRHDATRTCTVIGTDGTLRWNGITGTVELIPAGGAWETVASLPADRDTSYVAEWRHFFSCVASRSTPLVSGADGLAAMRIVDAAREASDREAVVRLDGQAQRRRP